MEVLSIASGAPSLPGGEGAQGTENGGEVEGRIRRAHGAARQTLKTQALLTDVYFHFSPSQIMFASLYLADGPLVTWLLDQKFPAHQAEQLEKTKEAVVSCAEMLSKVPPVAELNEEEMRELRVLSKKLKKCQDPEKVDLVKARREKMELRDKVGEDEERAKVEKRKEQSERLKAEGDALFGGSLKA